MVKTLKPTSLAPVRKGVIYARVSSKEQEKEGFSIPAQLKLLKDYAAAQGIAVAKEYVDAETAKQIGRTAFGEMIGHLKAQSSIRVLLVEKTDRLYRNLKDWVTVDELEVEIHFVKEGVVLSRGSRSSEKFMHGIKVLMAKNYIDNLSEEARKGMLEKAEQGIWPTVAPLGYRNVAGADGKKIIEPDPESESIISRLFEWYATGTLSLKEAAQKAKAAGLVYRKSGAPVPVSTVHAMLRNRLYMGEFEWNGHLYLGKHQPLVTRDLWQRVQGVLDGRHAKKHRRVKHDFAFSGLIACGHCGCSLVGEIKKQRYVYYHCTGYKGRCNEPYVREEVIGDRFSQLLGRLTFDEEVLAWLRDALHASHADGKREHEAAIGRFRAEYDRLQSRMHAMYVDKLDGKVDGAFFDRMSAEWRARQDRCLGEIERHQAADQSYLEEGVRLLELARKAQRLFEKQEPREKRRLLDFVVSNCTWKGGELVARLQQPFDLLAETTSVAAQAAAGSKPNLAKTEIWLPGPDSNQRPTG
jgi:DNA invertase Pin-like site-specific DNA recombinase